MHEPRELADKAGLPPGSLRYAGDTREATEPMPISLIAYDEAAVSEHDDLTVNAALELEDPSCVNWFNVSGPSPESLEAIGKLRKLSKKRLKSLV